MIETLDTSYTVECDACGEREEIDKSDLLPTGAWRALIEELKARGWRITRAGGDWHHACPACAETPDLFVSSR